MAKICLKNEEKPGIALQYPKPGFWTARSTTNTNLLPSPNMIFLARKKIMLCKSYIKKFHSMIKSFYGKSC